MRELLIRIAARGRTAGAEATAVTSPGARDGDADAGASAPACAYEPPRLLRLGSLADLTRGGDVSDADDGFGSAGASGVL
jgi:hypothetical protein